MTTKHTELKVKVRNLRLKDYKDIHQAMEKAYHGVDDPTWELPQLKRLLKLFPEGQIVVEVNGKVVAAALSLIVDYDKYGDEHTYNQITDHYKFNTHTTDGDVLYGIDVFVHPDYRGLRLGRRLYDARKELCENLNLRAIIAGGRIPGYTEHAGELTPQEYIEKVESKELYDPILTFQIANNFHVKKILKNYLEEDKPSQAYATLLEWNNIYYEEQTKLIGSPKSVVRIGLVQWQMRRFDTVDEVMNQAEFFVDTVSDYGSDFIVFPELFNAPLMAQFNDQGEAEAIRSLAGYTEEIKDRFLELAVSYNINIIAGTMPEYKNEVLRNVSYLCRRDGTLDYQYKLHMTPAEEKYWGMTGGDKLRVMDTDAGKIGIQVCYDVEFPEVSRLMSDQGMELLFVPFMTDTQNGYARVRQCARARAIENECYIAIAGSVGNLPRVNNMDIQYAQSAVFSPSDFAFPTEGIVQEATPNTEMTVIVDVNLDLLKEMHIKGSVQNMLDRRTDLYDLKWKGK